MGRGTSGRIVVEIEPDLKNRLYSELSLVGITFKEWLIYQAETYISNKKQPSLFIDESSLETRNEEHNGK